MSVVLLQERNFQCTQRTFTPIHGTVYYEFQLKVAIFVSVNFYYISMVIISTEEFYNLYQFTKALQSTYLSVRTVKFHEIEFYCLAGATK
jgi:hypothetical protein